MGSLPLQWGRARRRGRTLYPIGQRRNAVMLQWGRARRRGRTPHHTIHHDERCQRFNGAAPEGAEERLAQITTKFQPLKWPISSTPSTPSNSLTNILDPPQLSTAKPTQNKTFRGFERSPAFTTPIERSKPTAPRLDSRQVSTTGKNSLPLKCNNGGFPSRWEASGRRPDRKKEKKAKGARGTKSPGGSGQSPASPTEHPNDFVE